ncbi:MAG: hypothetical protein JXA74_06730 [Anaerolineae bacterium]|nr:hypothetical protein [Anaerolineae bacterium]
MRRLSPTFMRELKSGFLAGILERVIEDLDLDLHIRDNYINIYFKGNALLKLAEVGPGRYQPTIRRRFLGASALPDLVDRATTNAFLAAIPTLKANIARYGRSSLEIEYEQLIIRANNVERRNNSEYYVIDRQVVLGGQRLDLLGFHWPAVGRRRGQTVAPCLLEVKFAINASIGQVQEQLARHYAAVALDPGALVDDAQSVLNQRLELGLYDQPRNRLDAMRTLTIARELERFQFILVLVDYNPHSSQLDLSRLAELPFARQIRLFRAGFAMWEAGLQALPTST